MLKSLCTSNNFVQFFFIVFLLWYLMESGIVISIVHLSSERKQNPINIIYYNFEFRRLIFIDLYGRVI